MPRISNKPIQLLKGFKDILPEHQAFWEFFNSQAKNILENYSFQKIDVPVLEQANLYVKGTGKHTDIVQKELYSFEDKGGNNVSLRPEFTPGICRAYIEHGMLNQTQPVKLYTFGSVFRHDNPQSGRFRQFNQLNLEAIGSNSPILDAQIIIIGYRFLESLGLPITVNVNSIGCSECRPEYITTLKQFLSSAGRKKQLCENCKERYTKNPLRILDCKEENCKNVLAEAPQVVDSLCDDCKKDFMLVLEQLDDLDIDYNLDVRLVRGLDYYNKTAFEFYLKEQGEAEKAQSALGGGGRYDYLIELLGGRPTPAVGLAIGVERVITKMRELKVTLPAKKGVDVFVAQLGVEARKECFRLFERLAKEGIKLSEAFSKDGLKNQLERADASGAKLALILGQRELLDKTIIIRDMNSGIQETINYNKVIDQVKKQLDSFDSAVKSYKVEGEGEVEEVGDDTNKKDIKNNNKKAKAQYKLSGLEENENDINRL